jgi:hypothetical protein
VAWAWTLASIAGVTTINGDCCCKGVPGKTSSTDQVEQPGPLGQCEQLLFDWLVA